jgi:hypothetical protein
MKGKTAKTAKKTRKASAKRASTKRNRKRESTLTVAIPVGAQSSLNKPLSRTAAAQGNLDTEPQQQRSATLSGDLTGVIGPGSSRETSEELMNEGQDLEGELVEAVEATLAADQGEVPIPREPRARIPDYRNRNRL